MREVFSCAALSGSQSIPTKYHPHGLELDPAERASEAAPRGGYGRSSSELRDIKTLIKDMKISMTDGDLVGNSRNFVAYAKDIGDSVECLQGSWSLNAPEYAKKPVHEGEKMLTTSSVEESWASVRRRPRSLPGASREPPRSLPGASQVATGCRRLLQIATGCHRLPQVGLPQVPIGRRTFWPQQPAGQRPSSQSASSNEFVQSSIHPALELGGRGGRL